MEISSPSLGALHFGISLRVETFETPDLESCDCASCRFHEIPRQIRVLRLHEVPTLFGEMDLERLASPWPQRAEGTSLIDYLWGTLWGTRGRGPHNLGSWDNLGSLKKP